MITIAKAEVDAVQNADGPDDLHESLRGAMRLEHSTIPLYLTAYFSLLRYVSVQPDDPPHRLNVEIAETLRSIVVEEMLHFAIVANVLNAIGGRQQIDHPSMVPHFPDTLPMGVEAGLKPSVGPMSIDQCRVFMQIEEPEDPVGLPPDDTDLTTIGDFYRALIDKIAGWSSAAFGQPSAPQVLSPWYRSDRLFAIKGPADAANALKIIVEQGEGTTTRPFVEEVSKELAHYYRFGEIVEGRRFVPNPNALEGFDYSGDEVTLDTRGIYPMRDNAKLSDYAPPPGDAPDREADRALRLATQFCATYRHLLTCLQKTFTGSPEALDTAFGLMYELRTAALAMLDTPDQKRPGFCLTPAWEYLG